MIRDAVIGIWLCISSVSAMMFAQAQAPQTEYPSGQEAEAATPLQYRTIVPSGMMSITDIRDGQIKGYFLSRLLFVLDTGHDANTDVPQKLLFSNAFASVLANIDLNVLFTGHGIDVEFLQAELKKTINSGLGYALVHTVLIQQLEYLNHAGSTKSRSRKGLVQGGG